MKAIHCSLLYCFLRSLPVTFAKMRVDLGEESDDPNIKAIFAELFAPAGDSFPGHEKHGINWLHVSPFADQGDRWDDMMKPDAPSVKVVAGWKTAEAVEPPKYGSGSIEFVWSDDDPWAELEVVKVIGARRTVSNVQLLEGEVVGEVPARDYAPHSYHGWDVYHEYMDPCLEK